MSSRDFTRTFRPRSGRKVQLTELVERFSFAAQHTDATQYAGVAHAGTSGTDPQAASMTPELPQCVVTGVAMDSREVTPGDVYLALPGSRYHGAEFAAEAVARGAVAIVSDEAGAAIAATRLRQLKEEPRTAATGAQAAPLLLIAPGNPRHFAGELSAVVYGTERSQLTATLFGVTGTNGKTSVVYLLAELLRAAGLRAGISSTVERGLVGNTVASALTSPEAPELHALLALMTEQAADGVAIEVSAHAVHRHRIDGVTFDLVGFSNFARDHLDDFADLSEYFAAKLQLFTAERASRGVVNIDDTFGRRIARESRIPVTTLATGYGDAAGTTQADWQLAVTRQHIDGVSFVLQGPQGAYFRGSLPMFGRFMAANAGLALVMLHEAGISCEQISAGLHEGHIPVRVPGRLEAMNPRASLEHAPRFYVDYGHNPHGFQAILDSLAEIAPGRIIFMFGADGERDAGKRAEMGRVAAAGSDIVIVCDLNPRSEPPEQIRAQILAGAHAAARAAVYEEGDPRAAIRLALSLAQPGDVIVYAGAGHEDYFDVGGKRIAYSTRDEVRQALREAGKLE